jgi:hypothetical protein
MDFYDPEQLPDTAAASLGKDLGEKAEVTSRLRDLQAQLERLPEHTTALQHAELQLAIGRSLQILERGAEAWSMTYTAFGLFLDEAAYQLAADCCDVLYQCDQLDSLAALGQGIWLAVTFPIDPEITVRLLSHVVEDTPDDSDGAAVAAATACLLTELRCKEGPDRDRLMFFAQQLLGKVARRHGQVEDQIQFDSWVEKLELNDPDKFLVRLRNVVDVLVQDNWWFDRAALQANLPHD